jgi:hypothetical protein
VDGKTLDFRALELAWAMQYRWYRQALTRAERKPIEKDTDIMRTESAKFSFKIPEGHDEAGKKIEKSFDFDVCENEQEAQAVIEKRKWNIVDLVNENLKANARSSAYQSATLPYKASDVSPEDIAERMVRDYIRLGFGEDEARGMVEGALKSRNQ